MLKNPPLQIMFAGRLTIALAGCTFATVANIANADIDIANIENSDSANPCHLG